MNSLLREILTSRVYEVARETPLDPAPRLSRRLDNVVLLKREDLQPLSGANMNFDRLRFVAERAELGEGREALLAVTIPERPGALLQFLDAPIPRLLRLSSAEPRKGPYLARDIQRRSSDWIVGVRRVRL